MPPFPCPSVCNRLIHWWMVNGRADHAVPTAELRSRLAGELLHVRANAGPASASAWSDYLVWLGCYPIRPRAGGNRWA